MAEVGSVRTAGALGIVAGLLAFVGTGAAAGAGQETIVIPDEVSCPECEIRISKVASLGGKTEDKGLVCSRYSEVATDGKNHFFVADSCWPGQILLFDYSGEFIRKIARLGEGPQELGNILRIWTSTDGLVHAFESGRTEASVSPSSGVVRKWSGGYLPHDVFFYPDGTSVRQFHVPTPDLAGMLLHLVDSEGEIQASFGPLDTPYRGGQSIEYERSIADAGGGLVWSARTQPYEIELWSVGGDLKKALIRNPDWWVARGEDYGPGVIDIRQDANGYLWTNVLLTADEFDPGASLSPDQFNEVVDSMIEVIDPGTGRLITSRRSDLPFTWWMGDMFYTFREDEEFDVFIDVWRVQLKEPQQ